MFPVGASDRGKTGEDCETCFVQNDVFSPSVGCPGAFGSPFSVDARPSRLSLPFRTLLHRRDSRCRLPSWLRRTLRAVRGQMTRWTSCCRTSTTSSATSCDRNRTCGRYRRETCCGCTCRVCPVWSPMPFSGWVTRPLSLLKAIRQAATSEQR